MPAWIVMRRELGSFFVSPLAYVVLTSWLVWNGVVFWVLTEFYARNAVSSGAASPLSAFFGGSSLFFIPLLVFVPILTMRLIAGERQSGTIEPLMTAPVSDAAIILGKYGAAIAMWCVLWLPTVIYASDPDMPIAAKEFMFPFVNVVECPQQEMLGKIGYTLVGTGITDDAQFQRALIDCTNIDRLNLGPDVGRRRLVRLPDAEIQNPMTASLQRRGAL